ncbi:hypothetical protein RQM47_16090 [Rubrivirga sp. S365]|uniref:hypothetical protein n=1 Tax=Rubrivirga sp. S365 TaxID=3076080 RepID=UPI0028C6DA09|nr:hypothetical protein [Rubrivirga sp. S365]MDT7858169.1 hypothetical protein [Rubrivirga sp. S365]
MPHPLAAALSALALAAAALAGCGATEPVDPAPDTELSFALNGEPWTANTDVEAVLTEPGLVVFAELRFDDRFPLRQGIGFAVPWRGTGVYPIIEHREGGRLQGGYVNEADGDATIALYEPVGGAAERGGFEVTRYDEATGAIEGRFAGVFVVDSNYVRVTRRELSDTLRVTDGHFRAVVEDRR